MNIEQEKMIVESLPSIYPMQKFEEDAIETVLDALPRWIPCNKRLPTKSDEYLVSTYDKCVFDLYFSTEHGWDGWWNGRICAWMQKPEPYSEVTT